MKTILLILLFCGALTVWGNNFIDEIAKVERWINKKYSDSRFAKKLAEGNLQKIIESNDSEEAKLTALKKKFPEAFQKEEMPLIFLPPVSWNIHSLSLGYDLKESQTKIDIIKELSSQEQSQRENKSDSQNDKSVTTKSVRGTVSANAHLSFNPFKWLSNLSSGGIQLSGSLSAGKDAVFTRNQLWSKEQQHLFAQKYEQIEKMIRQTSVENLHLTFTLTITNNSREHMTCNLNNASIPIYMGDKSINNPAKPYKQNGILKLSPRDKKDIVFRVDFDTTTARELIRYMGHSAPDISISRGTVRIESKTIVDAITEAQKRTETVPVKLFLPGWSAVFNIRKRHTSNGKSTTVREALEAINQDIKTAIQKNILHLDKNGLYSFSDIPLGKFSPDDKELQFYAFLQLGDKFLSEVGTAELDKPLNSHNTILWGIDLKSDDFKSDSIPFDVQKKIFETVKKATVTGNVQAQFKLGWCYDSGIGVEKNAKEVVKWYKKAAERGHATAQNRLAWCYNNGIGVEKDEKEAVKWYRRAAEQGYAAARYNLGYCYQYGIGVERDDEEGVKWYKKAAEQGYATAQCNLGDCYYSGTGVEKDVEEAVKWYRKAAEQGHAVAQNRLGLCYDNGTGVEKDEKKAVKWYRKAAEQGYAAAQCNLGVCYEDGTGVEKDEKEAVKWFRKAAEQGYATAQNDLGNCYYRGTGVEKDVNEVVKWYKKAAEQGYATAQGNLGACYQLGFGVEKDEKKAVEWYQKAAEQGNATAQGNLGACYQYGIGIEKDVEEAVKWYKKAARQGNTNAKKALEKLGESY